MLVFRKIWRTYERNRWPLSIVNNSQLFVILKKKERSNKIGERNCSGERHCLMPMLLFKGSCSRVFYRIAAPKKFVWFSGKHDVVRFLHTRHWRNNLWFWLCSSVHLSVFLPVSPSTTNGNWNGTLVFPEVEIHKLRKLTESDIWKKKKARWLRRAQKVR